MKVLKIGAEWCPECVIMKPRWAEIESELSWLQTEYFDYDQNPEIKEKYKINHVPTFIFLDEQENEFLRLKGIVEKEDLLKILNENKNK
jgi:thiol-disulfide isomerase/thioredoxin